MNKKAEPEKIEVHFGGLGIKNLLNQAKKRKIKREAAKIYKHTNQQKEYISKVYELMGIK